MIRNIIFDIGNVLTDFRFREFLADLGHEADMVERIAEATVMTDVWQEFDRGVWSEEELLEGFIKNDPDIEVQIRGFFRNIKGMVTPRDFAIPWIEGWKDKGYGVWYLSNLSHKVEVECEEALRFLPYMDGGILSYQEKLIKPDLAIYELLLQRYGLEADECVFIDDTKANIDACRTAGMHGILYTNQEEVEEMLEKMGVIQ